MAPHPPYGRPNVLARAAWLGAAALVVLALAAPASPQIPEYEAKAEFLERFTRFIDWPAGALSDDPSVPFVIGVIGRDPFGRYLDGVAANRRIKNKAIKVRRFTDVDDVTGCHLLFVAASEERALSRILARAETRPVLTVGDSPGFGEAGVQINLVTSGDKIAFEINEAAARRSGLVFSSKLLRMARIVGGGAR